MSYPTYAQVTPTGQAQWTWEPVTSDLRALQRSGGGRLAATWYGQAFSITVNLTDGLPHNVALYCLDWDTTTRIQRFDVRDAQTNALLDTRTISNFNGGQYLVWTLTGRVRIEVTHLAGHNAVVNGLFFGPAGGNSAPSVTLTAPADGAVFTAPASMTVSANASDSDGTVTQVEFFASGTSIGVDTTSPYSVAWSGVGAGNYTLTAVATDNDGATKTSSGVSISVTPAGVGAGATFLGIDTTTRGS